MWVEGADEDVAGDEGFEVYEGEGVGCCEEDLCGVSYAVMRCFGVE